jgi:hypothetical protein
LRCSKNTFSLSLSESAPAIVLKEKKGLKNGIDSSTFKLQLFDLRLDTKGYPLNYPR